jgi:hypothetical protein
MDVIKLADYIIDIGLEGGKNGGEILCTGTPEEIIKNKKVMQFLKERTLKSIIMKRIYLLLLLLVSLNGFSQQESPETIVQNK